MAERTFLFLQGPPSRFAAQVAGALEQQGHRTLHVNLCAGDMLTWPRRGAINYRGRLRDWNAFLTGLVTREGVTDIVYYADRLPYHVVAREVAGALGINAITYEFGYLRPDWITLERGGMSAYSHFPDDPDVIRKLAHTVPAPDLTVHYPYHHMHEAAHEVFFTLSTYFLRPLFPFYTSDRVYNPLVEYVSHVPRILFGWWWERQGDRVVEALVGAGAPFFLFPLQIQSDYQLRDNSPYRHQSEAIGQAVGSFAAHAPAEAKLVFKQHPLDSGLERWGRVIEAAVARHGVADRVHFVHTNDLATLIRQAEGVVTINSTVGVHALRAGRPVKVLGIAAYDIAGLTCQHPLDDFWTAPPRPDPALCADLVRLWASSIQVKGNFYTRAGRRAAAANMACRLAADAVNEPGAYVCVPPRLARARAMGIAAAGERRAAASDKETAP